MVPGIKYYRDEKRNCENGNTSFIEVIYVSGRVKAKGSLLSFTTNYAKNWCERY